MGKPHTGRGGVRITPLLVAAVVSLATLGLAAPAMALKPTGLFANFGECPQTVTGVNQCVFATSSSGEFSIKKTTVPITKSITLQGGIIVNETTGSETFVEAADGNTLSKTPQTVPGGLLKVVAPKEWPEFLQILFNEFINKGITGVTETTELVATPSINRIALLTKEGSALTLPTRIHLENSFLGPKCYVGSKAHPAIVELTTGTTNPPPPNKPITGVVGELKFEAEGLLVIRKNTIVNNTFAAPVAEGCGSQILFGLFTGIIDGAVDSQLELPSASGNNTAILSGTLENATVEAVKKSEK
jgi:hypothetical protein